MNECGEIEYRYENLDDQIEIFFLEDENKISRMQTALTPEGDRFGERAHGSVVGSSSREAPRQRSNPGGGSAGVAPAWFFRDFFREMSLKCLCTTMG